MHPTRRNMETQRANHAHLFGNVYVVRTQAGLRKALKHFQGDDPDTTDVIDVIAPNSWPAVVEFSRTYIGGLHAVNATAIHVNELRTLLETQ